MSRPRLLDLFCGAGGAAVGYDRAGFEVVGVDIKPQPRYPFEFVQADALDFMRGLREASLWRASGYWLRDFDAIHASPPCQAYIRGGLATGDHPDLLPPTRELLEQTGLPWVIENVPGAPMHPDLLLCGSMFDIGVRRHRWFEFSWGETMMAPAACDHSRPITGVYGNPHGRSGAWPGMLPSNRETWSKGMGIDWMTLAELKDAIPPAYTEYVGGHLMRVVLGSRDAQIEETA